MTNAEKIPLLDLSAEIDELWTEVNAAIQAVLRSGHFIGGPEVAKIEAGIARYLGVKHAVALNSGTDALVIGLRALGIKKGDEVITTPFSFFATAEAVSLLEAVPVFVDIDPDTYNIDPKLVEKAVTKRTKALIPVHLFGYPAAMDALTAIAKRHDLAVLEDVAQALGSTFGGKKLAAIGDAGALSFFPSKNLGAYGDGGMLVTDSDGVAETARILRSHGSKVKYENETVGYNSRLDALQAAVLNVKLPRLDTWLRGRARVAARYDDAFGNTPGLKAPLAGKPGEHTYYSYTVRVLGGKRDQVRAKLTAAGIETMLYYPTPLHKLPVYKDLGLALPHAEKAATEVLSLPIWPQMSESTQDRVIAAIRSAL